MRPRARRPDPPGARGCAGCAFGRGRPRGPAASRAASHPPGLAEDAPREGAAGPDAPARCLDVDRLQPRVRRRPGVSVPGLAVRLRRPAADDPRLLRPRTGKGRRAPGARRRVQRWALHRLPRPGSREPRALGPGAVGPAPKGRGRPQAFHDRARHLSHPRICRRSLGRGARAARGGARPLDVADRPGGKPAARVPLDPRAGDASRVSGPHAHLPLAHRARVLERSHQARKDDDSGRRVVDAAARERPRSR